MPDQPHDPSTTASLSPLLRIKLLDPRAILPAYQTDGSAGMDLAACLPEGQSITLPPGERALIPCGYVLAIPHGYEGQVRPRSGLASKFGVTLPNTPGTIDSDYRGQAMVSLVNLGRETFTVTHAMRIAQLVIAPVTRARVAVVDSLEDTARGSGGFGSTGTH
ncbi:MAG: dUTP diphosphatase [Phycisphaerae bacterium]|nr:dUTP diphosphatase [Phycisphaerae bacterium]